jgi:hypothetical protein
LGAPLPVVATLAVAMVAVVVVVLAAEVVVVAACWVLTTFAVVTAFADALPVSAAAVVVTAGATT